MLPRNRPPTSPGRMLRFFMEESNISIEQLEKHLSWPPAQLEKLLQDQVELTEVMVLDLGDTLKNEAEFWLNARNSYNLWHALQGRTPLPSIY
jgi:addiction module HigA family antidote